MADTIILQSGDYVWVKAKTSTETWYKGLVMKGTKEGPVRQVNDLFVRTAFYSNPQFSF